MSALTIPHQQAQSPAERAAPEFSIPADLIELDQWLIWRYERRSADSEPTKVPYRVDGRRASSTNPADWTDFEQAWRTRENYSEHYDGLGWVFTADDPFCGLDLDDCLEDTTGDPRPWCRPLLERFSDTYVEVSPSGLGLKIWCRGKLPANVGDTVVEDGAIGLFDHAKYFTLTGMAFRGAPLQVEDHADDVLAQYEALAQKNGTHHEIAPDGKIPYGTQHLSLVSLCGTLRRRNVCETAIEACLQAVNVHQCERPGPPANISRIVTSSRGWGRS